MAVLAGEVPARADGVELIGELVGSGYRRPPALVRRADGQTIQLTPLLYQVLEEIDGRRSYDEVAAAVTTRLGRTVTADNVRHLADHQLRTMGLLVKADGGQPEVRKSNPLLALRFKYAVTDPERTRRLTTPFARLFNPVIVVLVLAAFAGVCWWVFMEKGLASATYEAFNHPGLLLLVLAVTLLSAGFHEFGHAAAARRGGATPGVMGAGIYLVWPAFYTDVTDSYRLGRGGRVRTDLGGLYFNAIVAVGIAGIWYATQYDALLLVVATQILQMVRQLTPIVRFDGYHVLADVTGVPDLFHRIKPTLLGLLPWRWHHPETTVLKPWARAVVTVWVLVVVPMLLFSLATMVLALPRIVGTAWTSAGKQSTLLGHAWHDADFLEASARVIAILAVTFPILASAVILTRTGRRIVLSVWRRTSGKPLQRGIAGLVGAALIGGLAYAWWPHPGRYRPIQPYEGGTLVQTVHAFKPHPLGLLPGQYGEFLTAWGNGDARPTAARPALSLILIPRTGGSAGSTAGDPGRVVDADSTTGSAASPDTGAGTDSGGEAGSDPAAPGTGAGAVSSDPQPWVFPFDKPLQPGPDDNQSLAVNTRDNTISYDVAFALVWITDDSPALNRNESYAFASCTNCGAVSVAFQVVLVTGENHVAAPQNISAAVNYDCVNCLTYALATQLFLTLDGPLSDDGMKSIAAVWQDIADFGKHITEVPLSQMQDRLTAYEQQIMSIIETEQGPLAPDSPSSSPSATSSESATSTASPTAPSTGASSSPSSTGSPSDGPNGTGTAASSADPRPSGTGSSTGGSTAGTSTAPGGTSSAGSSGSTAPRSSTTTAPSPATSPDTTSSPPSTSTSTSSAASSDSAARSAPSSESAAANSAAADSAPSAASATP
jgi:putative peptide zinc metalloprotease protein